MSDKREKSPEEIHAELSAPFPAKNVRWRVGSTAGDGKRGQALCFIDARAVMNRLDDVVGPNNWNTQLTEVRDEKGGLLMFKSRVSIRYGEEWVAREDVAEPTDYEAIKGGASDSFKRCAVQHGIARYLYDVPAPWVDVEKRGKSYFLTRNPEMPDWALPENERGNKGSRKPQAQERQRQSAAAETARPESSQSSKPQPAAQGPKSAIPPMSPEEHRQVQSLFDRIKAGGDPERAMEYVRNNSGLPEAVQEFVIRRIKARMVSARKAEADPKAESKVEPKAEAAPQQDKASKAPDMTAEQRDAVRSIFDRIKAGGDSTNAIKYVRKSSELPQEVQEFVIKRIKSRMEKEQAAQASEPMRQAS